jgi:serine O-acetyltransferase
MDFRVNPNSVAIFDFHDGNAGQVETWFESVSGYHIACFVHEADKVLEIDVNTENKRRVSQRTEFPKHGTFKGRPLIVAINWHERLIKLGIRKILLLTPDNKTRFNQVETCREYGFELVSAIHPTVTILPEAKIEPGVWINAGCIIGYKAEIESGVLINTGVQIDHHNVLKKCCQVDPGVVTAGNVTLWERCHVHTGSVIINRIEIGTDTIIGAGAVVTKNIPPRCTAVGVPARVIKYHTKAVNKFPK